MYLKLTIVFQLLWILVSTEKTTKAIYENIPNLISNEQSYKFDDEGVRSLQEKASSQRVVRTLTSLSTEQDIQHLSDANGTSIVSSHYTGERTTIKPTEKEEVASISNHSYLALQNFKGTVSESFLKKFNEHWLKFPPQSPTAHYILAMIYFIMAIFGLTGNFLVIFIFIKSSNVRTPANNLILNLAISDFLIMLEAPIFIYNSLNFGPAVGEFGCNVYGFLGALGGTLAIMTLTFIAIDRYNVIVFPLDPSRSTTNMRSRMMILLVWIFSLPFCALPVFEIWGIRGYIPEGFLTACSFDYLDVSGPNFWFIMIYAFAAYFLPLIIISYCYIHILHVVLSAQKIQSSKEKNKTELRLAAIVMGIIGLWMFAWTPYCLVSLIGILGYKDSISPLTSMIPAIMAKTAACIDPYLYAVTHPRFRTELENMFCKNRRDSVSNVHTSYHSRRRGKYESECESIEIGACDNKIMNNKKEQRPPLKHAESSFCEESNISNSEL